MARKTLRLPVFTALLLLLAAAAPAEDEREAVLRIAGLGPQRRGLCLDLACGDGRLAARIATQTQMTVFAVAADEKDCTAGRDALEAAGVYGTRATAVIASPSAPLLPDGYGNLIVAGKFDERLDLTQVTRLLNPNGVAVLGGPAVAADALKAALQRAGVRKYEIVDGYAVLRGTMPENVDDWTHWKHGPDNNPVSADVRCRPPFRTQWIGGTPGNVDMLNPAVIARGRLVLADTRKLYGIRPCLYAWDAFNGTRLWQHELKVAGQPTTLAMVGHVVYTADGEEVTALDAGTGRTLRTYRVAEDDGIAGRWIWLAVVGDALYVQATGIPGDPPRGKTKAGDVFFALDRASGRLLWKHTRPSPALMYTVSLGGGAIHCYSPTDGAAAIDLKTGELRWRNAKVVEIIGSGPKGWLTHTWAVYYGGRVYFFPDKTIALDATNGEVAWTSSNPRKLMFIGPKAYTRTKSRPNVSVIDPDTGELLERLPERLSGCGTGSGSASGIYSAGQGFTVYDLPTRRRASYNVFRSSCGTGIQAANGMLFAMPCSCNCNYPITGPAAVAPAGKWTVPDAAAAVANRLQRGPAFDGPLAEADAADAWPSLGGNAGHTGVAATAPVLPLKLTWQRQLAGRLTPASIAGGLVFVGSGAGLVWALDAGSGEVRWRFRCGGGVPVTPTCWRGRVLFGSHDGFVYCLDAATGKPAWRFRAAPEPRYVNVQGHVTSLWPVQTGVLVDDGVAYFAAGMCSYDGAWLYAMRVATGEALWVRPIGHLREGGSGVNPQGAMAAAGELLLIPCGGSHPAALRKSDGKAVWWHGSLTARGKDAVKYAKFNYSGGSELVAEGDAVFVGGPRLIGQRGYPFLLRGIADGLPYGTVEAVKAGRAVLARNGLLWEYYVQSYGAPLLTERTVYAVTGWQKTQVAAFDRAKLAAVHLVGRPQWKTAAADAALWSVDVPRRAHAFLLAGSTVVAAGAGKVVAVEAKADGKPLGDMRLSGKVLRGGLAASRGHVYAVTEEGTVARLN